MDKNVLVQNRQPLPGTVCIPSVKEVVCRWGAKCFHDIHYADTYLPFGSDTEVPIPPGACLQELPIVTSITTTPPVLTDGCVATTVGIGILAILVDANGLPIGIINKGALVNLQIPIHDVPNVLCFGPVIKNQFLPVRRPRVYSATITTVQGKLRAVFRVEKEILYFESRHAIVCQLECAPDEPSCTPPMPTPPTSPGCPTFTTPTVCFEFCVDDELTSPYNCDQCPPPQVIADPVI